MGASVKEHWEQFIEEISWFLGRGQIAEVEASLPPGSWTAPSHEFDQFFPALYRVLREAIVTPVAVSWRPIPALYLVAQGRLPLQLALASAITSSTLFASPGSQGPAQVVRGHCRA